MYIFSASRQLLNGKTIKAGDIQVESLQTYKLEKQEVDGFKPEKREEVLTTKKSTTFVTTAQPIIINSSVVPSAKPESESIKPFNSKLVVGSSQSETGPSNPNQNTGRKNSGRSSSFFNFPVQLAFENALML